MKKIILLIITAIIFAGCNSIEKKEAKISKEIEIKNPWIRSAAAGMNTALFFDLKNNSEADDSLVSVESDAAELIQIHETIKAPNGMMQMKEIGKVSVRKGTEMKFKPMGKHIMFILLHEDLPAGDSVEVKFNFSKAKSMSQKVVVKDFTK